jgi:diguanylate cyclase (GGDEF)-like protein
LKRLLSVVAIVLGLVSAAWATAPAPPAPLTSLHAIRALTNEEASQHFPVAFEATVTSYRNSPRKLYVQDGDSAIYVFLTKDAKLVPGDRVLVRGTMQPSYRPLVESSDITVLGHNQMVKPVAANYSDLVSVRYICRLVTIRARVRSADRRFNGDLHNTYLYLHLLTDDGGIDATVERIDGSQVADLLDTEVEITGVAARLFDSKMQQTGTIIRANTMADVKILKRANSNPWTLPITPMDTILAEYRVHDLTPRVRVHGTITYYQPGTAVVLQDGPKSIWIDTETSDPLQIGDVADATGFPDVRKGFLNLVRGDIQDSGKYAPVAALPATWQSLSLSDNIHFGHIYDLVSIEGQVVTEAREAARDAYVVNADGHLFTAIYNHSNKASQISIPAMKVIPIGSKVRITGICIQQRPNPWNSSVPFDLFLRSFDDIAVVSGPPLLNVRNLTFAAGLLLFLFLTVFARGWLLERKMRRQTTTLANVERRRGRILADINGSRPLTEIIVEITGLVSFQLNGVSCWCEIADGTHLGDRPSDLSVFRVAKCEISSRCGASLGAIFVAMDTLAKPLGIETDSLFMAAGLATLAIETRRLYTDLIHRSEFDQLTEIHNRFSLEKHLDAQIEDAHQQASIFGLIYIDLDGFKQVNDLYGHRIGDLYLQEVSRRMKEQLRSHDLLARLGGDEFAVLLPMVRNRADVEEVAQRLEACFNAPLILEEYTLRGTASFGFALYPQDGTTGDGLLNAADTAMYEVKNSKKQNAEMPNGNHNLEPAPKGLADD